jgi:hypothetical protein
MYPRAELGKVPDGYRKRSTSRPWRVRGGPWAACAGLSQSQHCHSVQRVLGKLRKISSSSALPHQARPRWLNVTAPRRARAAATGQRCAPSGKLLVRAPSVTPQQARGGAGQLVQPPERRMASAVAASELVQPIGTAALEELIGSACASIDAAAAELYKLSASLDITAALLAAGIGATGDAATAHSGSKRAPISWTPAQLLAETNHIRSTLEGLDALSAEWPPLRYLTTTSAMRSGTAMTLHASTQLGAEDAQRGPTLQPCGEVSHNHEGLVEGTRNAGSMGAPVDCLPAADTCTSGRDVAATPFTEPWGTTKTTGNDAIVRPVTSVQLSRLGCRARCVVQ